MLIRKAPDLRYRDATPKHLYLRRREFIRAAGVAMGAAAVGISGPLSSVLHAQSDGTGHNAKIPNLKKGGAYSSVPGEKTTSFEDVTSYNNFYEYGYDKSDPKAGASRLKPRPWSITVEGFVAKKGTFGFDEFIKPVSIEERVYRMRCVEAWSMVIPWAGIPLKDLITYLQPTPQAKYVEFVTAFNPAQMPAQNSRILPWPYVEGLRMDEAMNPLTILAVGLYDEWIPNQNGAPIRLVTPWKYGFKGVKSISKIRFVDYQPKNTWQVMAPNEYGFFANVNPDVSHPRWRQDSERRIGEFFRRKTLPFNGYADQVASMYTGMDLKRNF